MWGFLLMLQKLKAHKFRFFLIKAAALYSIFYFIYEFFIKRYTSIDRLFIRKIISLCRVILEALNYKTFASKDVNDFQVFGIDGSAGVWIGAPCNGITLMFLFALFVVAYPGKAKTKFWFVPLGVAIVFFINIIRIVSLSLIAFYKVEYLNFNHTYTFTFLAYTTVFALWMIWVKKFSGLNNEYKI